MSQEPTAPENRDGGATSAPAATLSDRRDRPRGVLPRRSQLWVMLAIAGVLLSIILLTGNPRPDNRPTGPREGAVGSIDRQRVESFEEQLAGRQRDLERQMMEHRGTRPADETHDNNTPSGATADPLADEKRRREYESLFADNIALTRRTEDTPQSARLPQEGAGDNDHSPALSAVDEHARQAFERLNESLAALQRRGDTTGPSTRVASEAPPAAGSEHEGATPAHTPPIEPGTSTHRLLEGTLIETTLMTRLEGDFTGPVLCLVTSPVYSHYGEAVVVPAGAKVLGRAKAVETWGQRRLAVAFHRLVLPDGETFSLDQFTGLDQGGDSGLTDKVNRHYWSTFGAAAAVGLISGFAQYVSGGAFTGGDGDRTVVITGGTTNSTAQAAAQVMNRYVNRLPTITIREGHRLKVYLTQDLTLPAYEDNRRARATTRTTGGL